MKKHTIYLITVLLLCFCYSCLTPQYIPVESVKTEYRDKILRDSVYRKEFIFLPHNVLQVIVVYHSFATHL